MSDIKLDITKELSMLTEALKENDELYTEVKEHYDKVKKGGPGTLQFVEKQTANLISLKSNKISIIQQIVNTKKVDAETRIKILNANKGEDGNDKIIRQMADSMYDLILKNKKDKSFDEIMVGTQKKVESTSVNEEDIDALLEARLKEEQSETIEEVQEVVQPEFIYVVDMDKNIYCIDSDYNIVEDASIPDVTITIKEMDGEVIATDEHGNMYDVVEFE
jgi:hypothetical protein